MSKISRDYQAPMTGFAPFTERKFVNIEFDGFRPAAISWVSSS